MVWESDEAGTEFERSGLSGPRFAELAGVKYQTFPLWVQQRRHAWIFELLIHRTFAREAKGPGGRPRFHPCSSQ